jgi:adenosylmethionine-8-amino-7-oxononanoate aminotransferase
MKASGQAHANGMRRTLFLLDRHLRKDYPVVVGGKGNLLHLKDGRVVFDAAGGAAVSCLGHGNERITTAISEQLKSGIPYLASGFWGNDVVDELCKELINGTGGKMARVYLTGSGWSPPLPCPVIWGDTLTRLTLSRF